MAAEDIGARRMMLAATTRETLSASAGRGSTPRKEPAMTQRPHVRYEQDGPVTVITIDRPERMNAIGPQTHGELVEAWDRFRVDDDALVAVLTGAGDDAFCAGGDLKAAFAGEPLPPVQTPAERAAHDRGERPGVLGPSRWTDLYKPTIAAVNGVAYAGGLEWVCWTDLAIADEHATFGVTCRRWNIGLADGGTQRLPRIVGFRRAMDLIITGRVIDAHDAKEIGLVNEVVPSGTCVDRAVELAHQIAALPQPALRTDKEAAVRGFGRPLDEGLRIEAQCFNRSITAPETLEGLRRFNERDHPDRRPGEQPRTPGLAPPAR
jgi:enoyl-CoA hydratase